MFALGEHAAWLVYGVRKYGGRSIAERTALWVSVVNVEQIAVLQAEHAAMRDAIHTLFAVGGAAGMHDLEPRPLPVACKREGPWQAPGTVTVRVQALRRLAKAGGVN